MTQATPHDVLPWGKHKGTVIKDLPKDYLSSVAWAIVTKDSEYFCSPSAQFYVLAILDQARTYPELVRDVDNALIHLLARQTAGGVGIPIETGS